MTTQDNSNIVMPTQDQRDIVRPSTELGTPSLTIVQVSRSPSLPSGSPFWDQMDLISPPSSPSPSRVPESTMDLDRYVQRGFSEDLALPPRQIEKPFRFLDLPAEIRHMIYRLTFREPRAVRLKPFECNCIRCSCGHRYRRDLRKMIRQWSPPRLALVSKRLWQETVSLYYAVTDFKWYWDPLSVFVRSEKSSLVESIGFLQRALDFASKHDIQIKGITVCSPDHCTGYDQFVENLVHSVQVLAPLQQSLEKTGKAHPNLREIAFSEDNSLACRIFDFAGSLKSYELINEEQLDLVMRDFLHQDPEGAGMICAIEDTERWVDGFERYLRREKKKEQREANKAKGPERWNSVLRGRKDNEANKDEGPERWNGALRGRATRGRK
ncbi:hypothetical protein D6C81_05031 [Aureobasidium pullulans]|nr:hypothetical protein D6C81_05031 [Aureobasidium pullulans]